ncbi:VOC family protein [Achromobacter sp. UMC46]|uniref:bleomycin resistance protein n=1 Tax=Achromobacter sp. UMC46 TaxID=1862319 RepID=UPI0015FFFC0F|nr:glyoxalase [Achromobacter sp. UMC46]
MENGRAQLVPELLVTDVSASLKFWTELCGFSVMYSRKEDGFFYLDLAGAQVMLVEVRGENGWITAPLNMPLGRGINFEIKVDAVQPTIAALASADWPLFRPVAEQWYRSDAVEIGVREFLVQDPDGYLLRFSAQIGQRPYQGA